MGLVGICRSFVRYCCRRREESGFLSFFVGFIVRVIIFIVFGRGGKYLRRRSGRSGTIIINIYKLNYHNMNTLIYIYIILSEL